MAVTFVIGNASLLSNFSLFLPGNSITSALANRFAEASQGCILILGGAGTHSFLITFIVLTLSKLLLMSLEKNSGGGH